MITSLDLHCLRIQSAIVIPHSLLSSDEIAHFKANIIVGNSSITVLMQIDTVTSAPTVGRCWSVGALDTLVSFGY